VRDGGAIVRIAFLDRDGVLNVDKGYEYRISDLEWMPEAREAVRWLNEQGYRVVVVTNQSGIGRGLYAVADYESFMSEMQGQLAEAGGHFDAVYYCPHRPEEGCDCRKPKPGMILQGLRDFGAQPADCFLLGDKATDLEAAARAGVPGQLYAGGSVLEAVARAARTSR
jgi:D-glycero-D-manno-heptose 1,7-bisphosphate phosphatase